MAQTEPHKREMCLAYGTTVIHGVRPAIHYGFNADPVRSEGWIHPRNIQTTSVILGYYRLGTFVSKSRRPSREHALGHGGERKIVVHSEMRRFLRIFRVQVFNSVPNRR